MLRKIWIILIVLILIPCISHAKTETIFADHKYVMGDNDSKNDARRMCFLEAKRKVLEKAGTYIESHSQAKNYQLTKDEINSYASALLKVETVKEEWQFVGENMAIFMTVKAKVDTGSVEKQLAKIKKNTSVQKKIKEQQDQIRKLEFRFLELQKQLGKADSLKALPLRKRRTEVFQEIDEIEERYKYVLSKIEEREKVQKAKEIESVNTVRRFINKIEIGMTLEEVKYIFGEPERIDDPLKDLKHIFKRPSSHRDLCYGNIRVRANLYKAGCFLWYNLPEKDCGSFIPVTLKSKKNNILLDREIKVFIAPYYCDRDECTSYIKKNILGPSSNIKITYIDKEQ